MGSFMIQSLVRAVVLNRPMQLWGLLPNRTQGLRPYRGSYLPVGPQVSGAMAASERGPTEYRSPCTQGLGWSRVAGPKNKNPRDPLRVREAHKTINPEG